MVDAADLKSAGDEPYGFESRPEHQRSVGSKMLAHLVTKNAAQTWAAFLFSSRIACGNR